MALTATVSPSSMEAILDKLGMTKENTCIMRELPNKLNIINKYSETRIETRIEMMLQPVVDDIQRNGQNAEETIIF